MNLLFIGDIVGKPGRTWVRESLPKLREDLSLDLVIANGENAAGGNGITPAIAQELFDMGIDGLTLGNHAWDKKELIGQIDAIPMLVRPANYPEGTPGKGWMVLESRSGHSVAVINLMGRVYLPTQLECPFRTFDRIYGQISETTELILVDFHAEATSEKQAFGWYVDGRATAVVGTHTHVQTNDARLLAGGTGYITDVGMTGPRDSVLGIERSVIIDKFLTQMPQPFKVAKGTRVLSAVMIQIDEITKKCTEIRNLKLTDEGI